jgi:putative tricarboxylic transport membrane protein
VVRLDRLLEGLHYGLQPEALVVIAAGLLVGIVVGAAPGIGPTVGMTIAVPFALNLSPSNAVLLLVSILVGSGFSNSIPAVLVKVPGTSSAILTVTEGNPFQVKGEAGRALLICLTASVVGQFVSIVAFILFVIPLSRFGVKLLFPEMFAIILVGLFAAAGLVNRQVVKGFVAVSVGLALATVGPDPITGQSRFTFGSSNLAIGLSVIPVVIGLLAFREVFAASKRTTDTPVRVGRLKVGWFPRLKRGDGREMAAPIGLGSVVGTVVGAIPGAGGSIASFLAYQVVRSASRDKSQFGKGSIRGLAAVDSSNNAVNGGELIPTFGLGLPGAPPMVVVMAVLSAQGLQPGPRLLETNPELLYATFGGLLVATLLLAVMGYFSIGPSVFLSKISPAATLVLTTALVVIGVYSIRWSLFDVWVALAMGVLGYLMEEYGYSVVAVALAFVLGGILEASLRRGLVMTFGWVGFFTRPVTLGILVLALIIMVAAAFVGGESPDMKAARDQAEKVDLGD